MCIRDRSCRPSPVNEHSVNCRSPAGPVFSACRRDSLSEKHSPAPAHRDPLYTKFLLACRRHGAFCKGIVSTARRGGVPFVRTKGTKIRLGLCPKTPLPLSCGWIRSQGACGAFCFGFSRDQIKNQPYKRRRVGRNLRLSRADPALCSGQPSPLRCILLSPQGLTTLRGPQFYGAYRRVGSLGRSPK